MERRPMTERQQRCICALHRRMRTELPAEAEQLDVREASMYIDRLQEQLSGIEDGASSAGGVRDTNKTAPSTLPFEDRVTLGLAEKLVHQAYNAAGKKVLMCKQDVKKEVKETFHLLREIERELAQAGGEA
jgi:hypothetical protein